MSNDCVILASWMPNKAALEIGEQYLEYISTYFSDCDTYIGINPSNISSSWVDMISRGLKDSICEIVPSYLVVDSDVSAYQLGLKLLRDSGKSYDLVYMFQTKSVSTLVERPRVKEFMGVFKNRAKIENIFKTRTVGSFSKYLGKHLGNFPDVLSQFYSFPKPYLQAYLYYYTQYVLRGDVLNKIIHNCSDSFFTKNLVKDCGGDRYFFERDFPQVIWRQGYIPSYSVYTGWNNGIEGLTIQDIKRDMLEYLCR